MVKILIFVFTSLHGTMPFLHGQGNNCKIGLIFVFTSLMSFISYEKKNWQSEPNHPEIKLQLIWPSANNDLVSK